MDGFLPITQQSDVCYRQFREHLPIVWKSSCNEEGLGWLAFYKLTSKAAYGHSYVTYIALCKGFDA